MKSLKHLFTKDGEESQDNPPHRLPKKWTMPINGDIVPLSQLPDEAFSQGMMGAGFAIHAQGNIVHSPIDGEISSIFRGGHAIAMASDDGVELLIHVGIESVALKGEGFRVLAESGAKVKAGEPLIEVDFEFLKTKLPSSDVVIIFTDIDEGEIQIENNQPVWKE